MHEGTTGLRGEGVAPRSANDPPAGVVFERDDSVLRIERRGQWACVTTTRDEGARALDILLTADEAEQLAAWLTEHEAAVRQRSRR